MPRNSEYVLGLRAALRIVKDQLTINDIVEQIEVLIKINTKDQTEWTQTHFPE